jgi:hypothetical protein
VVRSDLFGIAVPVDLFTALPGGVVPAHVHRSGYTPADEGIRATGGEEARPVEPHSNMWSQLGTASQDIFDLPAAPLVELHAAARSTAPACVAAPVAAPVARDATMMPLLIGLLGAGAVLALRRDGKIKRALLRVAAQVMSTAAASRSVHSIG